MVSDDELVRPTAITDTVVNRYAIFTKIERKKPNYLSDCSGGSLPIDLESLTLPDQPLMDVGVDVESILRHEMQQARDHTINFDL